MLNDFHKRAVRLLEPWVKPGELSAEDDARYEEINSVAWDIFKAALKVDLEYASAVATFLELSRRHFQLSQGEDMTNIVISGDWLNKITDDLAKTTAFPRPTKKIGALSKGRKLTRAGLMHRYHAFLIGELNTLGIAFYGCRDYPERMVPMDDAVNARTRAGFKNGKPDEKQDRRKHYPFFDESKLTARARSVLKSLKIDVEKAERR
jgi:hypothetical protein